MALLLHRLGRFSAHKPWLIITIWALILGIVGGSAALFHGQMSNNFQIPGTETQQMADKLKADLPDASGGTGTVVFTTKDGKPFTPAQEKAVTTALDNVRSVPSVRGVIDPFITQAGIDKGLATVAGKKTQLAQGEQAITAGQAQLDAQKAQLATLPAGSPQAQAGQAQLGAGQAQLDAKKAELLKGRAALATGERTARASSGVRFVSQNGQAAIAQLQFTVAVNAVTPAERQHVQDVINKATDAGVTVNYSKDITEDVSALFGFAEVAGVVVAAVVLLIMLGTLVAVGLPLLMALIGVGVGVGGTFALTGVIDMSSISPMLALMLGLAVGIDYSLFIINRHRQQLLAGKDVKESIALATGTSGNAVLFAGLTVVIALAALAVTGLPFLAVLGLAAAATVAVAVVIALTLTPALLSLIGPRIISRRKWLATAQRQDRNDDGEPASAGHLTAAGGSGRGWGRFVTRRPVLTLVVAVAALAAIAIPAGGLRLALPDGGSEPVASSAFKAYSLTGKNFGAGMNGPVIVVGSLPAGLTAAQATTTNLDVADSLRAIPNVVAAVPVAVSADHRTAVYQVIPAEGPASASTVQVVNDLRARAAGIKNATGVQIGLTGQTAANVDVSAKLGAALPPYLAIVVGLSLLLLVLVFRSILVPVLATAGFLLSLAASFGAVVAVYQWGWLGGVFGVENPAAVLSFLPIILIGVLFGLAMDYQVFIASGMREAHVHGQDARTAVRTGFRHAAPVVTAAAIIMTSVFSGFIFSHLTMVRPLGFALAFGVLIDAFVVRMTIVPAAMHLLGASAWWLPKWLERILPDVDVEGARLTAPAGEPEPEAEAVPTR
ncbi:MMPL family transporter [Specibacter cremeus]|uniref:MMPL family transporter n=1 Tax=Specibacter cremeus TaxID=1629051 RepID=UPI000F770992|nr:MMPL family transporter [Specibacter cremeus]